jgi:hypothetical protein
LPATSTPTASARRRRTAPVGSPSTCSCTSAPPSSPSPPWPTACCLLPGLLACRRAGRPRGRQAPWCAPPPCGQPSPVACALRPMAPCASCDQWPASPLPPPRLSGTGAPASASAQPTRGQPSPPPPAAGSTTAPTASATTCSSSSRISRRAAG